MTEEEAKTKWCPFARVLGTLRQPARPGEPDYVVGQGGQNRGSTMGGPLDNCRCIASACMAWRQTHLERGPIVERRKAEPMSSRPAGDDWGYEAIDPARAAQGGEWVRWGESVAHGVCGLAGAPG